MVWLAYLKNNSKFVTVGEYNEESRFDVKWLVQQWYGIIAVEINYHFSSHIRITR
jgi:hypothetical protein